VGPAREVARHPIRKDGDLGAAGVIETTVVVRTGPVRRRASVGTIEERAMAKGQKKSNKEIRKPKQDKAKPAPATRDFLTPPTKKK